jgi:LUD domain
MQPNQVYAKLPSDEVVAKTAQALTANGLAAQVVDTGDAAREAVLQLVPGGAEVFTMQSRTLHQTGITDAIDGSGTYNSVRNKLNQLDNKTQARDKVRLGSAPEYSVGSVHAVTHDGHLFIASNTGSQLAAYASGAGQVVWVVGAQKIVPNFDQALKRIYEYTLPLESRRLHQEYGVDSFVSKLLIINREVAPSRAHVILVKQNLGF